MDANNYNGLNEVAWERSKIFQLTSCEKQMLIWCGLRSCEFNKVRA